jgi:asparagine synthase (glutamine-hydrolysing)
VYTKEALSERSLKETGLFDAGKVRKLLRKVQAAESPSEIDSMALVGLLSSQLVNCQFVQDFPTRPDNSVSPALIVDRRSEALRAIG